jgi:hypothetical protein
MSPIHRLPHVQNWRACVRADTLAVTTGIRTESARAIARGFSATVDPTRFAGTSVWGQAPKRPGVRLSGPTAPKSPWLLTAEFPLVGDGV